MKSEDIYALGYAYPMYDISTDKQHFRFRTEEFTLKRGVVPMHDIGLGFKVAKIEDIRRAVEA